MRRATARAALFLAAAMLLGGCRDEGKPVKLTPESEALLREKADEKIGLVIRGNLPALFAGLVVFRSDAFVHHSAMLDQANLSVLNAFGNAALVLLSGPDIPVLLTEPGVKKIHYFCRQSVLPRIHPTLEMDVLRRFGEARESEPVTLVVRFRRQPEQREAQAFEAAGFSILDRRDMAWTVEGPAAAFPRLLENEGIIFLESASNP